MTGRNAVSNVVAAARQKENVNFMVLVTQNRQLFVFAITLQEEESTANSLNLGGTPTPKFVWS